MWIRRWFRSTLQTFREELDRAACPERGENVASQQLTGRAAIPGAVFWFAVVLGLLVVGLVAFLVVGGAS